MNYLSTRFNAVPLDPEVHYNGFSLLVLLLHERRSFPMDGRCGGGERDPPKNKNKTLTHGRGELVCAFLGLPYAYISMRVSYTRALGAYIKGRVRGVWVTAPELASLLRFLRGPLFSPPPFSPLCARDDKSTALRTYRQLRNRYLLFQGMWCTEAFFNFFLFKSSRN